MGGIPSTISAKDDSRDKLRLSCFSMRALPCSDRGCSTINSAEDEANPTQFLATHVKVPASSGNTSLITSVALLSS